MRKLTAGNKKNFIIFAIIIIGILVILAWCLNLALKVTKEEYHLETDCFLYDEEYNPITLEANAKIIKKWNGKYYLKDSENEYNIGTQSIVYEPNSKTIDLYGEMFRVYTDGTVQKLVKNNTITELSEDQIYKLGDRKYMVIAKNIQNEAGTLNTSTYLLILIDKAGNTYLLNNELNSRTIKPLVIKTQTFAFDVANEKLICNDREVNLKKIIGSTNQYVKPDTTAEEDAKKEEKLKSNIKDIKESIISMSENISNIKNNTNNNQENGSSTGSQGNNGNNGSSGATIDKEKTELVKSVILQGIETSSSFINVKYNIIDPENKYQVVYLLLDGAGITKNIALNKEEHNYKITELPENQEFKIVLATKQINENGEPEEIIEDVTMARTTKTNSTLEVTKLTTDKIYFKLNIDKDQNIDTAEIVLYIDGEEKERMDVDLGKAGTEEGWIENMKFSYGNNILLKIEKAMYQGKNIEVDIKTKIKTY